MKKKADVNWVIVTMVIGVIALAIIAFIFWKYSTSSAQQASGIARCEARGGECKTEIQPGVSPCSGNEISLGKFSCEEGQQCCIPVSDS